MNIFKVLPLDIVNRILTFSPTYYKENYKNRNGTFYKQIEEYRRNAISNVYIPIKRRCIKERFSGYRTYFWERLLGGKYILYIEDMSSVFEEMAWENDEDDYDPKNDLDRAYNTKFCHVSKHPHIGYGLEKEHKYLG